MLKHLRSEFRGQKPSSVTRGSHEGAALNIAYIVTDSFIFPDRISPSTPRGGHSLFPILNFLKTLCTNVQQFRGRLVFKACRLLYHSTLRLESHEEEEKYAAVPRRAKEEEEVPAG